MSGERAAVGAGQGALQRAGMPHLMPWTAHGQTLGRTIELVSGLLWHLTCTLCRALDKSAQVSLDCKWPEEQSTRALMACMMEAVALRHQAAACSSSSLPGSAK